jgi:hypothetical protein
MLPAASVAGSKPQDQQQSASTISSTSLKSQAPIDVQAAAQLMQ